MSGELHKIIQDRTGIDVRGLTDPRPAWTLDRIRERVRRRGNKQAERLLDRAEKQMIINQQAEVFDILQEDISKLGLISGNVERTKSSLSQIFGD